MREEKSEDAEARIENLMELVSAAGEYEGRDPEASLGGFVDRLSLLSEADEEDGAKKEDARVWLMSMHAAKGLEFPIVIVAGLEEGLFPHSRALQDEDDIEEERRICYASHAPASGHHRRGAGASLNTSQRNRRDFDGAPAHLVRRLNPPSTPSWASPRYEKKSIRTPRQPRRNREKPAKSYAYEERISRVGRRNGQKVRHGNLGLGQSWN